VDPEKFDSPSFPMGVFPLFGREEREAGQAQAEQGQVL